MVKEKQERVRETREEKVDFVKKQTESMRNNIISLNEAKKIIYGWIKQGQNYRNIARISFNIQDREGYKKFSISEIARIKKQYEDIKKTEGTVENEKWRIFELLEKGISPSKIVITTKYDPQIVLETINEYHQLVGSSPVLFKELVEIASDFDYKIENYKQLKNIFKSAIFWYYLWTEEAYYPCSICDKPVYFTPDKNSNWFYDICDAMLELRKNHHHPECT